MRAATPGFIFVIGLVCMTVLTIIVDVIASGIIIYHHCKQPFEQRPVKKIWSWVVFLLLVNAGLGFTTIMAYVFRYI